MTRVRIPPTLREQVSGEREVAADGDTVRELLDDLVKRFPALRPQLVENGDLAPFVNVYVEGEDVRTLEGIDTEVLAGSTVILLPAMAGGAQEVAGTSWGNLPVPPGPLPRSAARTGG
jgi:molybdopterin converting factor small subunit